MTARSMAGRAARRILLAGACALLAAAAAQAQNLVTNPHFHEDVQGWASGPGGDPIWTDLTEEGDCAGSGVALVASEDVAPLGHYAALYQCIQLDARPTVYATVRYLAYGSFTLYLDFYTATNCSAGGLGSASTEWPESPVVWADASIAAPRPGPANAAQLRFVAIDTVPHGLVVDAAFLGYDEPIFLDGFDGNAGGESQPCRWSAP